MLIIVEVEELTAIYAYPKKIYNVVVLPFNGSLRLSWIKGLGKEKENKKVKGPNGSQ